MPVSYTPYPKRSLIRLTFGSGGWLFLLTLLAAIALAAVSMVQMQTGQRLDANGQDATASVVKKTSRLNGTGTNKVHTRSFTVSYQFKTAQGANIRDIQGVSEEFYRAVAVGDQRPVRYLPSDPMTSEIEIGHGAQGGNQFMMLAALLFVVGLGGLFIWFRRAGAKISLRETGEIRHAEVVAHDLIKRKSAAAKYGRATWRDGNITGQTGALPVAALPDVGTMITLYAGPSGKPAIWEGEVGSR
ncbi:MAG: DUF3592 domain-containing protein [Rhodobacterales bacterium]